MNAYPLPARSGRRWVGLVAAGGAGAVVAATVTAMLMSHHSDTTRSEKAPPTVTLTASPTPPPAPVPLPAAEADRRTCDAWLAAGEDVHAASKALSVLPPNSTIVDPAVRNNPEWSAAAGRAADLYRKAGDALAAGITPGTTALLNQDAIAAAAALRALSVAEKTLDATNGNAYHAAHETSDMLDVLCERLAPR